MKLHTALEQFCGKNVLLLQGPIGPFFWRLARHLRTKDSKVFKLNFTGGDFLFYPLRAKIYRSKLRGFKDFLRSFYTENKIEYVICYNDCRPIHSIAIRVARKMGIKVFVFEEGYVRPNFITLEQNGVNANSSMPKNKDFYLKQKLGENAKITQIKGAFKYMGFFAFLYWLSSFFLAPFFNNALHHRKLNPLEALIWGRSLYRKILYHYTQKPIREQIRSQKKNYFVAILQVFNDTQISKHYKGGSVENFIISTLQSFAAHSRTKHILVFKHHPMDRGYVSYERLIFAEAKRLGISERVLYIHDCSLPNLLENALGCVMINSTTAINAMYHGCALKICGEAFYDFEGLCFQGELDEFWKQAHNFKPDFRLYTQFMNYLYRTNQINANYYKHSRGGGD